MGLIFKVLLTVTVVLVVWWVIKFRGRVGVLKAAMDAARKVAEDAKAAAGNTAAAKPSAVPVTLEACPKCGTYIAAGSICTCGKT